MCFNANASFGVGAVIGIIGIITAKKASNPSQFAFAGIPLIFAVQQFLEGFLWLALGHQDNFEKQKIATYAFIFIAQVIWPIWVPFSIMLLERDNKRKRILPVFLIIGGLSSLFGAYRVIFYDIEAQIVNNHIKYVFHDSNPILIFFSALYIIATTFSPFVSKVKGMNLLGALLLISLIISWIFFESYTVSVWCFFAAIMSSIVLRIILKLNIKPAIKNASIG